MRTQSMTETQKRFGVLVAFALGIYLISYFGSLRDDSSVLDDQGRVTFDVEETTIPRRSMNITGDSPEKEGQAATEEFRKFPNSSPMTGNTQWSRTIRFVDKETRKPIADALVFCAYRAYRVALNEDIYIEKEARSSGDVLKTNSQGEVTIGTSKTNVYLIAKSKTHASSSICTDSYDRDRKVIDMIPCRRVQIRIVDSQGLGVANFPVSWRLVGGRLPDEELDFGLNRTIHNADCPDTVTDKDGRCQLHLTWNRSVNKDPKFVIEHGGLFTNRRVTDFRLSQAPLAEHTHKLPDFAVLKVNFADGTILKSQQDNTWLSSDPFAQVQMRKTRVTIAAQNELIGISPWHGCSQILNKGTTEFHVALRADPLVEAFLPSGKKLKRSVTGPQEHRSSMVVTLGQDDELAPPKLGLLKARLVDSNGNPLSGTDVVCQFEMIDGTRRVLSQKCDSFGFIVSKQFNLADMKAAKIEWQPSRADLKPLRQDTPTLLEGVNDFGTIAFESFPVLLKGQVVDQAGNPVSRASVQAYKLESFGADATPMPDDGNITRYSRGNRGTSTGPQGEFTIYGEKESELLHVCCSTRSLMALDQIVKPGSSDLRLTLKPQCRLRGQLSNSGDFDPKRLILELVPHTNKVKSTWAAVDTNDQFNRNFPQGIYDLHVKTAGEVSQTLTTIKAIVLPARGDVDLAEIKIDISDGLATLDVELNNPTGISESFRIDKKHGWTPITIGHLVLRDQIGQVLTSKGIVISNDSGGAKMRHRFRLKEAPATIEIEGSGLKRNLQDVTSKPATINLFPGPSVSASSKKQPGGKLTGRLSICLIDGDGDSKVVHRADGGTDLRVSAMDITVGENGVYKVGLTLNGKKGERIVTDGIKPSTIAVGESGANLKISFDAKRIQSILEELCQ